MSEEQEQMTVWAFQPLPELNNQTGFVQCDAKLARELLAAGKVDDPASGSLHMRELQGGEPTPAQPASGTPQDQTPPSTTPPSTTPPSSAPASTGDEARSSQDYETTQMTPARSTPPKKRGK